MKATILKSILCGVCILATPNSFAAILGRETEACIPRDVQQLIVLDNRALQASAAARSLKDQALPPELVGLKRVLLTAGWNVDRDADLLTFAVFRTPTGSRTIGIAQGQFRMTLVQNKLIQSKIKTFALRNYNFFTLNDGSSFVLLDQTTLIFGNRDAVEDALMARDGLAANLLANEDMLGAIPTVDQYAVWSLLDQKGTQEMMRGVLGDAAQLMNYEVAKKRLRSSRYLMDFRHGVHFELQVVASDTITAATLSAVAQGAALMGKSVGASVEKAALNETAIGSKSGVLSIMYEASEDQFAALVGSALFRQVTQ